jgi:hypothetical protein
MTQALILKRAPAHLPVVWRATRAPLDVGDGSQRRHTPRAHRYEVKREAAMAAFAKSWRRE